MNDKDRIRLAEAMGWLFPEGQQCVGVPPNDPREPGRGNITEIPNPFIDANDDYAVLEWMREQNNKPWQYHLSQLNEGKGRYKWDYRIGDYARAALKVLDNERQTFNNRTGTP